MFEQSNAGLLADIAAPGDGRAPLRWDPKFVLRARRRDDMLEATHDSGQP